MDTATSAASPAPAAASPRRRALANAAFALFCVYIAAIYVLALDQNLHWGLFPTQAEKQINGLIQQLGDSSLPPDKHAAVMQDLVNWNTFAVPPLIDAIAKDPPNVRDPALKCLQSIALKYYDTDLTKYGSDSAQLRQWWAGLQADWAKAEQENK